MRKGLIRLGEGGPGEGYLLAPVGVFVACYEEDVDLEVFRISSCKITINNFRVSLNQAIGHFSRFL